LAGREWDPEAGLYYYRARYYDPQVGRFVSEDPIGFAGGLNFYGYVDGNPKEWLDPFGLVRYGLYANVGRDRLAFPQRAFDGAGRENSLPFDSGMQILAQLAGPVGISQLDVHSHAVTAGLVADPHLDNGLYLTVYNGQADLTALAGGAVTTEMLVELVRRGAIDLGQGAEINFFGCNTDGPAVVLSDQLAGIGLGDVTVTGARAAVSAVDALRAMVDPPGLFNSYRAGRLVGSTRTRPYRGGARHAVDYCLCSPRRVPCVCGPQQRWRAGCGVFDAG
jgi:RHS repeat-associated protein